MKKYIYKYLIIAGIFSSLIFTSCVNSDEYDFPSSNKPMASAENTELSIMEGETGFITLNIDTPISEAAMFKIIVTGGNAEKDIDYNAGSGSLPPDNGDPESGYIFTLPAYSETVKIPVRIMRDLLVEETETANLNISATGVRTILTKDGGIDITINIEDEVSNEFIARLEWDADYTGTDGDIHSFCDFDLDLEIYNSSLSNIVATSYTECPEEINIFEGDLADGQYYIVPSFYSGSGASGVAEPTDFESIPATLTLVKRGVFNTVIDLSGIWTEFNEGVDPQANGQASNAEYYEIVAGLQISNNGTTYTVTDYESDEVLAEGRIANSQFQPSFRNRR